MTPRPAAASDDAPRRSITRGTVTILTENCKGCELCIPACPPGVLSMSTTGNRLGYLYPELTTGCTGCTACQQVCPDFVFEVYRYHEPIIEDATNEGVVR